MKHIKVVIGANFGDEGKGQMTEYFANQAKQLGRSCLVVCHNGTAQRGHTCILNDGSRHIYQHLGAGTAMSADTYFSKDFIVNPIFFRTEYEKLKAKGFDFRVFVNSNCQVAIPFDIFINQELETKRNLSRHGSCGYGLYETILRNKEEPYKTLVLPSYNLRKFYQQLLLIRKTYVLHRLEELGIDKKSERLAKLVNDNEILDVFMDDMKFFLTHVTIADDSILHDYEDVVFEGGQGLLLDMDNLEYYPHLTPSKTGLHNPFHIIKGQNLDCPVEVCYVTRTYVTRHGAGYLNGECIKNDINPDMTDLTNVTNEFQESLRFAKLNIADLKNGIKKDFVLAANEDNFTCELAIMHENECYIPGLEYAKYHSNGMSKEDIYETKR